MSSLPMETEDGIPISRNVDDDDEYEYRNEIVADHPAEGDDYDEGGRLEATILERNANDVNDSIKDDDDDDDDRKKMNNLIECSASILLPFSEEVAFDAFSDLTRQP